VPRKNLAVVGGRTLVRRALETALAAKAFSTVALSSEDEEILAEAEGLDVVPIRRPAELATDTARAFDVVRHALGELDPVEAVAVVQATSPFTAPEDLAGAVTLLEETGAESVVSVARLEAALHPLKLKRLEPDGRLLPYLEDDALTPSHDLPPLWSRNGSIYISRVEVLDRGLLVSDRDVRGYEMPPERSYDIDTPRDLALARLLSAEDAPGEPA
jgi:CMP-N,N'-diacetyllegionaminic acid synthase